jgi:hypothetical protein
LNSSDVVCIFYKNITLTKVAYFTAHQLPHPKAALVSLTPRNFPFRHVLIIDLGNGGSMVVWFPKKQSAYQVS